MNNFTRFNLSKWMFSVLIWAILAVCISIVLASRKPAPKWEPLIPTPFQTVASAPPATPGPVQTPMPVAIQSRFGAGVPSGKLTAEVADWLGLGWYLTWSVYPQDAVREWDGPPGVEFWPMVRVSQDGFRPDATELARLAAEHPGATWIVGNEPDVPWQDNAFPQQYAMIYHEVYTLIKQTDPTARVAPAGVAQPTELRLRYLDQVLESYHELYGQPMPADAWTVHAFILREERDSWGAGIPPGLPDTQGQLVEVEQHDDLDIFRQYILRFRQWMAARGYRDRELAVTEYGILMPPDYGFGPERVRRFMWTTFDYFQAATDPEIGLPTDGNRLVQRWAWFSINDELYPASDLVDPASGQLTQAGRDFAEYVRSH